MLVLWKGFQSLVAFATYVTLYAVLRESDGSFSQHVASILGSYAIYVGLTFAVLRWRMDEFESSLYPASLMLALLMPNTTVDKAADWEPGALAYTLSSVETEGGTLVASFGLFLMVFFAATFFFSFWVALAIGGVLLALQVCAGLTVDESATTEDPEPEEA